MGTTFGDNIRKYREKRGMTQLELALALGYKTKGAVNKIENNVTRLPQPKIKMCADVLGIPVVKLFSDAEPVFVDYTQYQEYLPYIAQADDATRNMIRKILDMPTIRK